MSTRCKEITESITEYVEEWVEKQVSRQEERCKKEKCKWWMLCLNKLFCWLVWVVLTVLEKVIVPVVKTIVRVVCEVLTFILDVVAMFVGLVLSIPIIGGILRTLIDWVSEIVNRVVGIVDFVLSLAGMRMRKRMYVGIIVTTVDGVPVAASDAYETSIEVAKEIFHKTCNIELIYTGSCVFRNEPPSHIRNFDCNAGGFFSQWLSPWFFEMAALSCRPREGWRRIAGHGAEIIALVVEKVEPQKAGCGFANYPFFVLAAEHRSTSTLAHEIGHCCMLLHRDKEVQNLMFPSGARDTSATDGRPENLVLTTWQSSVIRSSRYCSYF